MTLSALTFHDTIRLPDGETPERVYWAACHHYGYTEFPTREEAEQEARTNPTRTETTSYSDRFRGVIPAGSGTVELRIVTKHDGGGIDTPLLRYEVKRERQEPA